MATTNKPSVRTTGRSPPFILIGLLLVIGVLGYNYWSIWNANADLVSELDVMRIQKKDTDNINTESEKKLADTRGNLIQAHESLNQVKKQLQSKESELTSMKTDLSNKQADVDKLQNEKGQCDSSLVQSKTELDGLKSQIAELQKQLEQEKSKPADCNMVSCKSPVKEILLAIAKSIGSDPLRKVLTESKPDVVAFMDDMPNLPAGNNKEQAENQKKEAPNEQQQQANKTEPEQAKGNPDENKSEEKHNQGVKKMNVDDNISQMDVRNNTSESVVFQADKDKTVNNISKDVVNLDSEKLDEKQPEAEENNTDAINLTTEPTKAENEVDKDNEEALNKTVEGDEEKKKDPNIKEDEKV